MAETQIPLKRARDEKSHEYSPAAAPKRLKPYDNILDLLDEEEDEEAEPSHELSRDLSAIFTALQKELSCAGSPPEAEADRDGRRDAADEDDGLKLSVMRHLLEASDDELGIPNRSSADDISSDVFFNSDSAVNDDGLLWELEDEAANYYTVLQSELFMERGTFDI